MHAQKEEREKEDSETKAKISKMTHQLNELKQEHYNVMAANEESNEKLRSELN